jgi:hypothetical protein
MAKNSVHADLDRRPETAQSRRQMYSEQPDYRWTAEQLEVEAARADLAVTQRQLRDWSQLGLLDHPKPRGRGRGRGVARVWSDNQRELLLAVLRQQARQPHLRLADLTNIPVWTWLAFGDDYVPIRQARSALQTWSGPARHPTAKSAKAAAAAVVRRLAHPLSTPAARRRLRGVVARGQAGEPVSSEELAAAARPVFDPGGKDELRGPLGARIGAAGYVRHVEASIRGVDAVLSDPDERPLDEALELVRARYLWIREDYANRWDTYANDPELGHMHVEPDLSELVTHACRDVTLLLGYELPGDWRTQRKRRKNAARGGSGT